MGLRRVRSKPVISGAFTIPYQDSTWLTARYGKTDHAVFVQCGNLLGTGAGAWLFSVPTVQIVDVQRVDWNGIAAQKVSFEGRHDSDCAAQTLELERSAFRLHIF